MKNVINYYYNLFPLNIHQKDKKFFFHINHKPYVFMQYNKDIIKIEQVNKLTALLENRQIKCNKIINNNMSSSITYVNNIPYVLQRLDCDNNDNIIFKDIVDFHMETAGLIRDSVNLKGILKLWMDKVDYFEYQVSQFGVNFPIIRYSFNYFVGMAENAIMILNTIIDAKIDSTICHYRVHMNMKVKDLYDPFNLIVDSRIRDVCEYLKEKVFFIDDIDLIEYYFKYNLLTNDEVVLFLSRFLYPTYYFDLCEKSIEENDESYLKPIIEKISNYEKNLKHVYRFLKQKYNIPEIEWLLSH